jgi:hypothetical protein
VSERKGSVVIGLLDHEMDLYSVTIVPPGATSKDLQTRWVNGRAALAADLRGMQCDDAAIERVVQELDRTGTCTLENVTWPP